MDAQSIKNEQYLKILCENSLQIHERLSNKINFYVQISIICNYMVVIGVAILFCYLSIYIINWLLFICIYYGLDIIYLCTVQYSLYIFFTIYQYKKYIFYLLFFCFYYHKQDFIYLLHAVFVTSCGLYFLSLRNLLLKLKI